MARPAETPPVDAMLPQVARVTAARDEAPGVVSLTLDWPGWAGCGPGQFNMLGLPGLGEVPISVSGGTDTPGCVLHTIRAVGPVSDALAALEAGAWLTARGPFGTPWPLHMPPETPVCIVAGGLGLAPLRPVVEHFAARARAGQRVRLVVGARGPADLCFHAEYPGWRRSGIEMAITVDHAPPGWPGHVGVVTGLIGSGHGAAYLCGPGIMMRVAARTLVTGGIDPAAIHLSLERNMQCGVGLCGHCQLGPVLLCRDGPVLNWARAAPVMMTEAL